MTPLQVAHAPGHGGFHGLSGHMASACPLAGLGGVHTEAGRHRTLPDPPSPSGLTCSCSSPCTDTVKTLLLPSRSEMVSRDLDTVPRVRTQKARGLGPRPSANRAVLFGAAPPLSMSSTATLRHPTPAPRAAPGGPTHVWRWHRDSMQTSPRTVSRARGRALLCSSLRSVGTASCSGPQEGWSRGGVGRGASGTVPETVVAAGWGGG